MSKKEEIRREGCTIFENALAVTLSIFHSQFGAFQARFMLNAGEQFKDSL